MTKTKTMNARLTQLLTGRGRGVALISRGRRGLSGMTSGISLVILGIGPASVRNLGSTNATRTSLFVTIAPSRVGGVAYYVLTRSLKTGGAITHVSGTRCLSTSCGRFFGGVNVSSLVFPRVLTTGRVIRNVERD